MRIICTLNDKTKGNRYSQFLTSKGIENQLETQINEDWGSPHYGDASCRIWVYDEDQVAEALDWIEQLKSNPSLETTAKNIEPAVIFPNEILVDGQKPYQQPRSTPKSSKGISCTSYLVLICLILFFIDTITTPATTSWPANLPYTPFTASSIKKDTFYDYPQAYSILDKAIKLYGVDGIESNSEAEYLLKDFHQTPYWHGVYVDMVHYFETTTSGSGNFVSPNTGSHLIEKIRDGEFWRLFTPCLMHNDILHILFNMLWLIVLGKQLEQRLGIRRYLLLVLLTGIFSNTCQYLMSGSDFLGFSGVLCAMLAFIWIRQKIAPWEGYPLERSTIAFMMVFILAMSIIQIGSFFLENQYQISISPGIANTAHLSGAFIGICMACLPCFAWNWRSKSG